MLPRISCTVRPTPAIVRLSLRNPAKGASDSGGKQSTNTGFGCLRSELAAAVANDVPKGDHRKSGVGLRRCDRFIMPGM